MTSPDIMSETLAGIVYCLLESPINNIEMNILELRGTWRGPGKAARWLSLARTGFRNKTRKRIIA